MLHLTLYKNCILNNNYQEVLSLGIREGQTKNVLERYLEGLQKYNVDLNNVYYENSGEIVIEFSEIFNPYEYNYFKLIDDELNLLRYCFINKIEIKNGCVYISYSEDIWSSYIKDIKGILPSYLSRTRVKEYSNFIPKLLELPVDYSGNNNLDLVSLSYPDHLVNVYVIVEIQTYLQVAADDPKNIFEDKYMIFRLSSENSYLVTLFDAETIVKYLVKYMPSKKFNTNYNYSVGNVYFIPKDFINESYLRLQTIIGTEHRLDDTELYYSEFFPNASTFSGIVTKEGNIQNDYKNLFIGTYDYQINLINNGTDFNYKLLFYISNSSINFKINALNQLVDITNSFRYDMPFTSVLSSEFAQRKATYMLEKQTQELQMSDTNRSDQIAQGIFGTIGKLIKLDFGGAWESFSSIFYKGPLVKWQKESYELEKIDAPVYSNSKGIFKNMTSICNFGKGLMIAKVNPDNEDYVKNAINNTGYKTYEYIYDINKLDIDNVDYFRDNNISYNYIKFDAINVYGSFPDEIADELNKILSNGVKIWYVPSLQLDNYEI